MLQARPQVLRPVAAVGVAGGVGVGGVGRTETSDVVLVVGDVVAVVAPAAVAVVVGAAAGGAACGGSGCGVADDASVAGAAGTVDGVGVGVDVHATGDAGDVPVIEVGGGGGAATAAAALGSLDKGGRFMRLRHLEPPRTAFEGFAIDLCAHMSHTTRQSPRAKAVKDDIPRSGPQAEIRLGDDKNVERASSIQ